MREELRACYEDKVPDLHWDCYFAAVREVAAEHFSMSRKAPYRSDHYDFIATQRLRKLKEIADVRVSLEPLPEDHLEQLERAKGHLDALQKGIRAIRQQYWDEVRAGRCTVLHCTALLEAHKEGNSFKVHRNACLLAC
jgi:hypothetical protein